MPNERTFAKYVSHGLRAYGHPQRHEDALSVGIPDLSFAAAGVTAWVELKVLNAFPKRSDTLVRIRTFTHEQLNWLLARAKHTPHVFLMLKVEEPKQYLLLRHEHLKAIKEGMTLDAWYDSCLDVWSRRLNFESLSDWLTLKGSK